MKKTVYLAPETTITEIVLQQMIAASGDPVVKTKEEDADENGEVLSRRRYRNDWEDEEYDEEENL